MLDHANVLPERVPARAMTPLNSSMALVYKCKPIKNGKFIHSPRVLSPNMNVDTKKNVRYLRFILEYVQMFKKKNTKIFSLKPEFLSNRLSSFL